MTIKNGTLSFVVRVKPNVEYYCQPKQQQPVLDTDFNKLVNDKETADVSFKAGRRVCFAHKSILKMRTPDL